MTNMSNTNAGRSPLGSQQSDRAIQTVCIALALASTVLLLRAASLW